MKKIARFIRNGYKILKIIESKTDDYNCEFKFTFDIPYKDIRISYNKMYEMPYYMDFETENEFEITYHKATSTKPTKVHIKEKTNNGNNYVTLPLTELQDLNTNIGIPFPIVRIFVPNKLNLDNVANISSKYKDYEIGKFNSIDIYIVSAKVNYEREYQKWLELYSIILNNDIMYFCTENNNLINNKYRDNYRMNKRKNSKNINGLYSKITDNIGILVNMSLVDDLRTDKLELQFLENKYTFGILSQFNTFDSNNKMIPVYKYDIENNNFSTKEKEKSLFAFHKYEKQHFEYKKRNYEKYSKYLKVINEEKEVMRSLLDKAESFKNLIYSKRKDTLIKYNLWKGDRLKQNILNSNIKFENFINELYNKLSLDEKFLVNDLIYLQSTLNLFLCKYLNINEFKVFNIKVKPKLSLLKKYNKQLDEIGLGKEFEYMILIINDLYQIELFRGEINRFFENESDANIRVSKAIYPLNDYYKYGIPEKFNNKEEFDIIDKQLQFCNKKDFKNKFSKNSIYSNLYDSLFNY